MIGKRIKQLRIEKRLSQQQLADKISSSSGYISEVESGKKIPGGTRLLSLKRCFGVSIDWLLTGNGHPYIKEGDSDSGRIQNKSDDDPDVAELLEMTRQIVKSDTSYAMSLMANIRSFHQAMLAEQRYQDIEARMQELEKAVAKSPGCGRAEEPRRTANGTE